MVSASDGALADLNSGLNEQGCKVTVVRLAKLEDDEGVTCRQEEIVRKAFEMGYFDYPKKVTIRVWLRG